MTGVLWYLPHSLWTHDGSYLCAKCAYPEVPEVLFTLEMQ